MKTYKKLLIILSSFIFSFIVFCNTISANDYGIDVANYQSSSLSYFQSFKEKGATFTIVKLGGSGGGEGTHYQNPSASAQLANAANAGLNVGGYFWGQFGSSVSSAKNMASLALADAKADGLKKGSVIALDYEAGANSDKEANTTAIIAFMQAIENGGYKPVLYSGYSYMKTYINSDEVGQQFGSVLWVASYKTTSTQTSADFNYFPSMNYVALWQFADNYYSVDGDIDLLGLMSNGGGVTTSTTVKATTESSDSLKTETVKTYTVKSGDSWYKIAKTYNIDMNNLATLNNKTTSDYIYPGEVLKLSGKITNNVSKSESNNSTTKTNTSSTTFKDGSYTITRQNSTFYPNQSLRVFKYPASQPTGAKYYHGESVKYDGYVHVGSYIYVSYKTSNGYHHYIAVRNATTGQALGTFK